jgi:hypothetical protein
LFNQKRREVDLKSSKTESKQTELLLNHEHFALQDPEVVAQALAQLRDLIAMPDQDVFHVGIPSDLFKS